MKGLSVGTSGVCSSKMFNGFGWETNRYNTATWTRECPASSNICPKKEKLNGNGCRRLSSLAWCDEKKPAMGVRNEAPLIKNSSSLGVLWRLGLKPTFTTQSCARVPTCKPGTAFFYSSMLQSHSTLCLAMSRRTAALTIHCHFPGSKIHRNLRRSQEISGVLIHRGGVLRSLSIRVINECSRALVQMQLISSVTCRDCRSKRLWEPKERLGLAVQCRLASPWFDTFNPTSAESPDFEGLNGPYSPYSFLWIQETVDWFQVQDTLVDLPGSVYARTLQ